MSLQRSKLVFLLSTDEYEKLSQYLVKMNDISDFKRTDIQSTCLHLFKTKMCVLGKELHLFNL